MINETYKFYANKFKMLFSLLICANFLYLLFLMLKSSQSEHTFFACFGIVFFGLGTIVLLLGLFNKIPLLTITPEYVRIRNCDKLLWEDIKEIQEIVQQINNTKIEHLRFVVKDIEKYQLTKMQKFNKKVGGYAFEVGLNAFKQKDKEQIKQIISQIKNIDKL